MRGRGGAPACMDTNVSRRRFLIVLISVGMVAALLIGVGIYGLIRGPGGGTSVPARTDAPGRSSASVPDTRVVLPVISSSRDPIDYAREVAEAIFEWDTGVGFTRSEYFAVPAAEAAPTGEESNGLIADLNGYYPTVEQWRQLLGYETSQYLTITEAGVPDSWAGIVTSSGDQLADGTIAVTIRGERHRTGVWAGETAKSVHEVAFTVFVLCPPNADRCHLLRLSGLDTPLE